MTTNERAPEGDRTLAANEDRLTMPLVEAMETQRAVRKVLPDPVDDDLVLRCIELALKAPTGSNGQNWEFVVVTDRAKKAPRWGWELAKMRADKISTETSSNSIPKKFDRWSACSMPGMPMC